MRRWLLASGRPPDGSRVFPARHRTAWVRVRKAAKLPDPQPRFHDLRHTAATFLLAAGLRSHVVAELLGHEDAGLVDRLYGHGLPSEVGLFGYSSGVLVGVFLIARGRRARLAAIEASAEPIAEQRVSAGSCGTPERRPRGR